MSENKLNRQRWIILRDGFMMMLVFAAFRIAWGQNLPEQVNNYPLNACKTIRAGANAAVLPSGGIDIVFDGVRNVAILKFDSTIGGVLLTYPNFKRGGSNDSSIFRLPYQKMAKSGGGCFGYDSSGSVIYGSCYRNPIYFYLPLAAPGGKEMYQTLLKLRKSESYFKLEYASCAYYLSNQGSEYPLGWRIANLSEIAK
jgi:hypothetical protein